MSNSGGSESNNFDAFQALFASLPKSTQQQLLTQVVTGASISNDECSPPKTNIPMSRVSVKVEHISNENQAEEVIKVPAFVFLERRL
jgi:hypothetical protein